MVLRPAAVFADIPMDDGDLGNFFANKDKKKKKKGTKVTSATLKEQLNCDTNNIEEQQSQQQSLIEAKNKIARPDDEEWVQINDDALADGLSDLKIKSLDAKEEEEELATNRQQEQEEFSDDDTNKDKKGPWSTLSSSPPKSNNFNPPPHTDVPQIPTSLVSPGGKYIPPSQRTGPAREQQPTRRGKEQINVNSVAQFPDLAAGRQNQRLKENHDPTFDTAKGSGSRKTQQTQGKSESVQLNNKFQALQQC